MWYKRNETKFGMYYFKKKKKNVHKKISDLGFHDISLYSLCSYTVTNASNRAFITQYKQLQIQASAAHEESLILYEDDLLIIINMWLKRMTLTDPFSMTRFSMTTPRLLCSHTISQKCPHVLGKGP